MKKNLFRPLLLTVVGLVLAGCSPSAPTTSTTPGGANKVVIKGSNTIGEELAPRLAEEFKKSNAGTTIEIESKGTPYGFGNLLASGCDIAAASREANETELHLAKDRGIEMNEYSIGTYAAAVVVNSANPSAALTREQVRDIFTGGIKNWKEVGGADAPINIYVRDPISGSHHGFRELATENKPYADNLKPLTSYADIVKAVGADANGIGYSSIQVLNAGVKGVSIGGVAPTVENVQQGKYPYKRVLHFYTRKDGESANAKTFIDFVQSQKGTEVKNQFGIVPQK